MNKSFYLKVAQDQGVKNNIQKYLSRRKIMRLIGFNQKIMKKIVKGKDKDKRAIYKILI